MLQTFSVFEDISSDSAKKKYQITDIKAAVKDQNRVNVYIDDKFFCSLDISQVVDLKLRIGKTLDGDSLVDIRQASEFGKLYTRALEYIFIRPRSSREIRDYLKRKTLDRKIRVKDKKTGEYKTIVKKGFTPDLIELVFRRLDERGYIDDYAFAKQWIANRHLQKGASLKKLRNELLVKGVLESDIERAIQESGRNNRSELRKIIAKKAAHYENEQKLIRYLISQGFNYSEILDELSSDSSVE